MPAVIRITRAAPKLLPGRLVGPYSHGTSAVRTCLSRECLLILPKSEYTHLRRFVLPQHADTFSRRSSRRVHIVQHQDVGSAPRVLGFKCIADRLFQLTGVLL